MQWLPQNDILGHPKTKLFITHCGGNSQYEALYHGVPMLGVPAVDEQDRNCARAQDKGISLCLETYRLSTHQLHHYIRELIDNAFYRSNVKRRSEIWRSESPIGNQKAGFWIDHVIKYGGSHLRSVAIEQPVYEISVFDVLVVAVVVTFF